MIYDRAKGSEKGRATYVALDGLGVITRRAVTRVRFPRNAKTKKRDEKCRDAEKQKVQ